VAPSLIALDATARIVGSSGERVLPLEEFFVGPGLTAMQADEVLTELSIPKTSQDLVGEYIKFSPREMMDLAYVGVAVCFALDRREKRCRGVRIVLGAVAPIPRRARKAEAVLEGQILSEDLAGKAGEEAARESRPISDVRSTAEYRRAMVNAMTRRALLNAAQGPAKSWLERRDRRH
jgi:aerobic carbon-monoxide dehydrogenase medium subunit